MFIEDAVDGKEWIGTRMHVMDTVGAREAAREMHLVDEVEQEMKNAGREIRLGLEKR